MTKASDNIFPKVTLVEGSAPSSPSASDFHLYFDSADHLLKWKNSAGAVTTITAGGYAPGGTDVAVADGGTGASTKAAGFDALSPMTTSGDIIYGGASGTGTRLAKGTDGQVLTLASGLPSWAAGGGGGGALVFLEAHTASASATLDFTTFYSSTYDDYVIRLVNLVPATNNANLGVQLSSDGGGSWNGTSNYYSAFGGVNNAGSAVASAGGNPTTSWIIAAGVSNSSSRSITGDLQLTALGSTALDKTMAGLLAFTNQSNVLGGTTSCLLTVPGTAFNAVRFGMSSGNITSGTIRIYGIATS